MHVLHYSHIMVISGNLLKDLDGVKPKGNALVFSGLEAYLTLSNP